jgi:hypothetical protein
MNPFYFFNPPSHHSLPSRGDSQKMTIRKFFSNPDFDIKETIFLHGLDE